MDFLLGPWNTFLVHPLLNLLVLAYNLTRDFGFAIVLVTVALRLALYPLFVAQIRSQRAMQELAPAMNELRKKYGKDRQKMTEEQMKLYRERGYNPAAGCLPLIVQMPILFAMYAMFIQAGGGPGQERPLNGTDLGRILWPFISNPLADDPSGHLDTSANWLPWLGGGLSQPDPIFILPVLAGATQLIASVMAQPANATKSDDPQQRMMQSMMYTFPLLTVVFALQFPSGLALYWVATTVFQIVQQYFVTGWGQLTRWVPFLKSIPTPADRELTRLQAAAVTEARSDMAAAGVAPSGDGAAGATAVGGGGGKANGRKNTMRHERGNSRKRRKR